MSHPLKIHQYQILHSTISKYYPQGSIITFYPQHSFKQSPFSFTPFPDFLIQRFLQAFILLVPKEL